MSTVFRILQYIDQSIVSCRVFLDQLFFAVRFIRFISTYACLPCIYSQKIKKLLFQGRNGEKGQKGEPGNPGIDVYSAVKVNILLVA